MSETLELLHWALSASPVIANAMGSYTLNCLLPVAPLLPKNRDHPTVLGWISRDRRFLKAESTDAHDCRNCRVSIGSRLTRVPVAANTAFAMAGAISIAPSSPAPLGLSSLGTM